MWPDSRVVKLVNESFMPARVHVKDNADAFKKYGEKYNAQWTPTTLMLDPDGVERHRIEGFLPSDDFLAQLILGRAKLAFAAEDWKEAERRFRQVVNELPNTDAAPEALYWAGVAPYKATRDPSSLKETARAFTQKYRDTSWAKKASVWG